MSLADKLQLTLSTKEAIKLALIDKGVSVTNEPFSHYPGLIEALSGGDFPVGTLADWKLGRNAGGWLECDGSQVSDTEYPDLADLLVKYGPDISFDNDPLSGVENIQTEFLAYSKEKNLVAAVSVEAPELRIMDTETWESVKSDFSLGESAYKACFLNSGNQLAVSCSNDIFIFNTEDWSILDRVIGEGRPLISYKEDTHELYVVKVDYSQTLSYVEVYSTSPWTGNALRTYESRHIVEDIDCNSQKNYFSLTTQNYPYFEVVNSNTLIPVTIDGGFDEYGGARGEKVKFSPSGERFIVSITGRYDADIVLVYSTDTWEMLTGVGEGWLQPFTSIHSIAITKDDNYVFFGLHKASTEGSTLVVADMTTGIITFPLATLNLDDQDNTTEALVLTGNDDFLMVAQDYPRILSVIPIKERLSPKGYFTLPDLPPKQYGNVSAPIMIKAES